MTRFRMAGLYLFAIASMSALATASASAALPEFSGPFPKPFSSTSKATVLETVGKTKVKCKAATNTGTITGPNAGSATITLTGCETKGISCNSPGAGAGEVASHGLTTTLGYINRDQKEVGIDLSNPAGALILEFQCGPATAGVVRGSVIGKITPVNKLVKPPGHLTVKFVEKKGIQEISKFDGGTLDILETSLNGGPFEPSGLKSADQITFPAPVEVLA